MKVMGICPPNLTNSALTVILITVYIGFLTDWHFAGKEKAAMTIAIISSLFFFAVAAILRTDQLKEMPVSKALSYYFLAEGVWTILAGLLVWIWAETAIWSIFIHYILIAIVAGYLFYCYCVLYRAKKDGTEDAKIPEPSIRRYIERRRANRARKLAERQAKKEQKEQRSK